MEKYKWILIGVFLVIIYFLINKTQSLDKKIEDTVLKAKEHEVKSKFYKEIYDNLIEKDSALQIKYDSLSLEKNRIKIKYNEKIKLVNKYSVSDMQHYFDERTK